MTRTRKIVVGIGVVVVIGVLTGAGIYYFTKGVAESATRFFATIAADGPAAAYRSASPAFQQAMSESDFTSFAERVGLTTFKSASWPQRNIDNAQGSVSGTITLSNDVSLPAKVQLAKNAQGAWQVFNFDLKMPGASTAQPTAAQPARSQVAQGQPSQPVQTRIVPSTGAGDEISAEIGDKAWSATATALVVAKIGRIVLVNTAPVVKPDHTIDTTSMQLQFDGSATGAQKLTRDCRQNAPCLELSADGNHYKIDDRPNATATVTITRRDGDRIEGDFAADMVALEGGLAVRKGHFVVTAK